MAAAQGGAGGGRGYGGGGGNGGATCPQLLTTLENAIVTAMACTPGAANQCVQQVQEFPDCIPGCYFLVNDATKPNAIRAQLVAQCDQPAELCPCSVPPPALTCVAAGGTDGGVCQVVSSVVPPWGALGGADGSAAAGGAGGAGQVSGGQDGGGAGG
jgi:hypothetical protein